MDDLGSDRTNERLLILLDSDSLRSPSGLLLSSYDDTELFEFVSIGASAEHVQGLIEWASDGTWGSITVDRERRQYPKERYYSKHLLAFGLSYVERLAQLTGLAPADLLLALILSTFLDDKRRTTILVTERETLFDRATQVKPAFPKIRNGPRIGNPCLKMRSGLSR